MGAAMALDRQTCRLQDAERLGNAVTGCKSLAERGQFLCMRLACSPGCSCWRGSMLAERRSPAFTPVYSLRSALQVDRVSSMACGAIASTAAGSIPHMCRMHAHGPREVAGFMSWLARLNCTLSRSSAENFGDTSSLLTLNKLHGCGEAPASTQRSSGLRPSRYSLAFALCADWSTLQAGRSAENTTFGNANTVLPP